MTSPLIKRVRSRRTLERAWRAIEENARTSTSEVVQNEVRTFSEDVGHKIDSISHRLARGTFKFGPAKGIPIPKLDSGGKKSKTKFRPIVLAPVESRIVQRAVLEALLPHPQLQKYSTSPYSFGGVKRQVGKDLAAVPAAIDEVLKIIGGGVKYVAFADISAFFTKIPKSKIREIIAAAVNDQEFMELFDSAVKVELSNLAELREKAQKFPIEDIGVAQGNSLSPLLGNILLYEFDELMNAGDCRCVRYIDDFIILAPTRNAATARMKKAATLLAKFEMEISAEKSSAAPIPITDTFSFLGIEFSNGFIRPSKKSCTRLVASIKQSIARSQAALHELSSDQAFPKTQSLVSTLRRIDGVLQGWSKHYRFCNDQLLFANLEKTIDGKLQSYLNEYRSVTNNMTPELAFTALGIERIGAITLSPLTWPKKAT